MVKIPELEKMSKVRETSQTVGAFLDWLFYNGHIKRTAKFRGGMEEILAKYFDIDLNKVEEERRALLEEIRAKK